MTSANMKTKQGWVPPSKDGPGVWKSLGDFTPVDFRLRARNYEQRAQGHLERAVWCHHVARLMDEENAKTLRKMKAELPVLPTGMTMGELLDDIPE
jgi:hypothetical protein